MGHVVGSLLAAVFVGCVLAGCDEPEVLEICRAASLCETPRAPANDYVLLCDPTPGSVCDRTRLADALDSVLAHAIHRPESMIEIWAVGTHAHDARIAATARVPSPPPRSRSISRWEVERSLTLRDALLDAFDPYFAQAGAQQRSAIAEALTRIGQSRLERTSTPAHLIVISDLREHVAGFSLECPRRLPFARVVRSAFARRGVLGPDALSAFSGVQVLAHALPPFPQRRGFCDVSMRREADLASLWSEVLLAAGAHAVVFRSRGASFEAEASDSP